MLAENVDMNETVIDVDNGSALTEGSYIYVDQEEMYIETINKIIRLLSEELKIRHLFKIMSVDQRSLISMLCDNAQIELGDDFGFDGSVF